MMRLLTWNIRHGGGNRTSDIAHVLVQKTPDVIALNEFRMPRGQRLQNILRHNGWEHQAIAAAADGVNGVLVAARMPFETATDHAVPEFCRDRWLEASFRDANIKVLAVHIPTFNNADHQKEQFWQAILERAARLQETNTHAVVVGGLNTGKHRVDETGATLRCADCFEQMEKAGWVDAWRSRNPTGREYTWFSAKGNGFRLDHAFLSPALAPRLRSAEYSHQEREEGVSDHSLLIVEFNV